MCAVCEVVTVCLLSGVSLCEMRALSVCVECGYWCVTVWGVFIVSKVSGDLCLSVWCVCIFVCVFEVCVLRAVCICKTCVLWVMCQCNECCISEICELWIVYGVHGVRDVSMCKVCALWIVCVVSCVYVWGVCVEECFKQYKTVCANGLWPKMEW